MKARQLLIQFDHAGIAALRGYAPGRAVQCRVYGDLRRLACMKQLHAAFRIELRLLALPDAVDDGRGDVVVVGPRALAEDVRQDEVGIARREIRQHLARDPLRATVEIVVRRVGRVGVDDVRRDPRRLARRDQLAGDARIGRLDLRFLAPIDPGEMQHRLHARQHLGKLARVGEGRVVHLHQLVRRFLAAEARGAVERVDARRRMPADQAARAGDRDLHRSAFQLASSACTSGSESSSSFTPSTDSCSALCEWKSSVGTCSVSPSEKYEL